MRPLRQLILAVTACSAVAAAQPVDGPFQVRYAANIGAHLPVVIFSNFGTSAPGFDSGQFYQPNIDPMCGAEPVAQQFVPSTTEVLQTVVLPLSSSDIASATFELLTNTGASPGSPGTLMDTLTFTGITATPTPISADSNSHPLLIAGTPYWLRGVAPPCSPGNLVRYRWYWASPLFSGPVQSIGPVFPTLPQSAFAFNGLAPVDPVVNFTNTGANNAQDICVNTYTFAPDEQLVSCCSCRVTRNALWSLGVGSDLVSNTLTADVPGSIVIKLLATAAPAGNCNPANPGPPVQGLAAWGTAMHWSNLTPTATGSVPYWTETPFTNATLSNTELSIMTSYCGFIQSNGSGYGICKACQTGSLGLGPNDPTHNTGLGGDKQ